MSSIFIPKNIDAKAEPVTTPSIRWHKFNYSNYVWIPVLHYLPFERKILTCANHHRISNFAHSLACSEAGQTEREINVTPQIRSRLTSTLSIMGIYTWLANRVSHLFKVSIYWVCPCRYCRIKVKREAHLSDCNPKNFPLSEFYVSYPHPSPLLFRLLSEIVSFQNKYLPALVLLERAITGWWEISQNTLCFIL